MQHFIIFNNKSTILNHENHIQRTDDMTIILISILHFNAPDLKKTTSKVKKTKEKKQSGDIYKAYLYV